MDETEVVLELWDKQPDEPRNWFLRFQRYYLYRGLARSIRRAYMAFLQENYPTKVEDIVVAGKAYQRWLHVAKDWNWKARAEAWDEARNDELRREVLQASRFLMENALKAAEALVEALESPRLTVIAANSILDRTGLPAVSKQELLSVNVPISADDLAGIREKVKEWETQQFEKSG